VLAVAVELLGLGEELRIRLAAVEEGDLMAAAEAASTAARPRNFVPPRTRSFTVRTVPSGPVDF
jgi:hypothetical protein